MDLPPPPPPAPLPPLLLSTSTQDVTSKLRQLAKSVQDSYLEVHTKHIRATVEDGLHDPKLERLASMPRSMLVEGRMRGGLGDGGGGIDHWVRDVIFGGWADGEG